MKEVIIVIVAGLIGLKVIANSVDGVLYGLAFRLAKPSGDPVVDAFQLQPSRARHVVLNMVRPTVSTLIIFGGGAIVVRWLQLSNWSSGLAFIYFFLLTQWACLVGRRASKAVAMAAMIMTMAAVVLIYSLV